MPWVEDGLESDEYQVVRDLRQIAWKSQTAVDAISRMPFLETIEPADALATTALRRLAYFGEEKSVEPLLRVMDHPTISDGITDEETKVVATLYSVRKNNPDLVDTLLDPEKVELEERNINLPLAGETQITIIRTLPGSKGTMDLLKKAVGFIEMFMGTGFPLNQINYLFENATPPSSSGFFRGANSGTHITSKPEVDGIDYSPESAYRHFVHETSHYYWRGNERWINEGAATFFEAVAENSAAGRPLSLKRGPCIHARTIAELETVDPEQVDPEFTCNYRLGERIFHDLYRNMDETTFRLGFRRLYMLSQFDDPEDGCEGTKLNVCHVKAAFTTEVPEETAATAEKVINRWYDGSEPYDLTHLDGSAVDPGLPSINGEITDIFISLDQDWPVDVDTRTDQLSITDLKQLEGRVFVYRKFSFPYTSKRIAIPLDTAQYYMDGFIYSRKISEFYFKPGKSDGWWRTRIGPSDAEQWRPGSYGVYMYDGDRKVAQVEYEVTP